MKRQRFVSQGALTRILRAASEAWSSRDFEKAFEFLERACRLDPANGGILLDLGAAYGKRFHYTDAERCLDKAIRVASRKTETVVAAGNQCRSFGRYDMAESYLRRAADQRDVSPDILVNLAEVYERMRRLDEAADMVDRSLGLEPAFPPALLMRARLERQSGHVEQAEQFLRSIPGTADRDVRVRAGYEMGAVLDRQGRYDEAMAAFLKAKNLLFPDAQKHLAELKVLRARLAELRSNLTAQTLSNWANQGDALRPSKRLVLLCGHPRSGTTLLEQVLDSHPEIVSAEETEIFHDDAYLPLTRKFPKETAILAMLESTSNTALLQSRENYFRTVERFLQKPLDSRLLVDKNPSLTFLVPALTRVFPEIKFLVALRDPRDVCLSCFMQPLPLNQSAAAFLSLEGTVQEYAALMAMWQTVAQLMNNPNLQVRYEDLVDDLEGVSREVLKFLEVPWNAQVLRFDEYARQKTVRSPTYADVTKPVFKTARGRWHNYQKYLEPHLDRLKPFLKVFGYE